MKRFSLSVLDCITYTIVCIIPKLPLLKNLLGVGGDESVAPLPILLIWNFLVLKI